MTDNQSLERGRRGPYSILLDERDRLKAEKVELREALENIAGHLTNPDSGANGGLSDDGRALVRRVAGAAIAKGE